MISGGPGCSNLHKILSETCPYTFNYPDSTLENPVLETNPYSWTKVANIIAIDHPVGTGFSYAKTPEAYITNDTGYVLGNLVTETSDEYNTRIHFAHRVALLSNAIYKVDPNNNPRIHDFPVVDEVHI
ncbi:hypothetical protein L2E82_03771 [Cichorium intybus]|uniref:Uncharacterized protein n=1 Tax=Cichorium intybus TaxID=13427 RepID=A0ACB9H4E3_CICIN|nr:hypothetical protein L2E82_03771 [Cichorium intybus]